MESLTRLFRGESVHGKEAAEYRDGARKVFLITTAIGEKYQKIGEGLNWTGIDLKPKLTNINWGNKYDMTTLPRISGRGFNIAVHYAVVVMKKSVYRDKDKSLSQKMLSARLWEHGGGNAPELVEQGDARGLDPDELKTIYAVEEIGETKYSDNEISTKFYRKLMADWQYFALWWNCHDLAIRLAYLIVANNSPKAKESERILTQFLINLKKSLIDRVLKRASQLGWKAILTCFVGIGVLGAIFPPAAAGEAVLFATWCAALFGDKTVEDMVTEGQSQFADYNERLQRDFPSLETLHRNLFRGLAILAKEGSLNKSNGPKNRPGQWTRHRSSGISSSRSNHR